MQAFLAMPPIGHNLEDFASSVLDKPSKATDMTQLLLEFNTMALQNDEIAGAKDKANQEMEDSESSFKLDPMFKFKDYFKFWFFSELWIINSN